MEATNAREADADSTIAELVSRARAAMDIFEHYDQEQVDEVVQAVAWAIIKRENAEELARLAVEDTGLGKYEDKVNKNRRKSLGTLRDLLDPTARSVGVIEVDEEKGITKIAKPVGVVAAVTPSTNPAATPANKTMMALKGRNAIIIAPSPKGASTCKLLLRYIHEELSKVGAPLDLVQALPRVDKELAYELMKQADFVTVTGSANNVRAGQTSGTPNACVSAGNVVSVVDSTAEIEEAARKIRTSKTFDYGTSCSNDNSVVIEAPVYDEMVEALIREGGYLCDDEERALLEEALWSGGGKRSAETLCKAPSVIAEVAGLENPEAREASFFMVEGKEVGEEDLFSGEKLSVVLTVYKAVDFDEALDLTDRILGYVGRGHSCGLHTTSEANIERIGLEMDVCRLLINQIQVFGNGGSFDNGLGFTLSMGGGSWAGNNIDENLSYRHFLNITRVSRTIPAVVPTEDELLGSYWSRYGR
ncbi:MAG: aldehyde dehydrogenase family protein [Actinomycetota bacterium]|nr:aldehyde dehydrogenase family protein [Actinomycetota bacterium]